MLCVLSFVVQPEVIELMRTQAETEKSENLYLYIDMPRFDFPVIFNELVCYWSCISLSRG